MTAGYAAIPSQLLGDDRLSTSDCLVLLALSTWLGCEEIRPSHAAIAKRAGVSINTVGRSLDRLRDLNLVEWTNRHREDGGKTSNVYRILTPWIGDPSPTVGDGIPHSGVSPSTTVGDEVLKREVTKKNSPDAPRRKPQIPLPADWRPTDKHRQQAVDLGLSVSAEAIRFRNYAEGKDWRMADWNATFRNWLIKAAELRPPQHETQDGFERFTPWSN